MWPRLRWRKKHDKVSLGLRGLWIHIYVWSQTLCVSAGCQWKTALSSQYSRYLEANQQPLLWKVSLRLLHSIKFTLFNFSFLCQALCCCFCFHVVSLFLCFVWEKVGRGTSCTCLWKHAENYRSCAGTMSKLPENKTVPSCFCIYVFFIPKWDKHGIGHYSFKMKKSLVSVCAPIKAVVHVTSAKVKAKGTEEVKVDQWARKVLRIITQDNFSFPVSKMPAVSCRVVT